MTITCDFRTFASLYYLNSQVVNSDWTKSDQRASDGPAPKNRIKQSDPQLTITPISAAKNSKARIDYDEQLERTSQNQPLVWDDSRFNKSRPGDFFGFYMYKNGVKIHLIEKVSSPSERLSSWSSNVGQEDRRVVTLSAANYFIDWDTWIKLDGAKRCQGTAPVKKSLCEILRLIEKTF